MSIFNRTPSNKAKVPLLIHFIEFKGIPAKNLLYLVRRMYYWEKYAYTMSMWTVQAKFKGKY